jgi:uncharacterized protein
MQNRTESPTRQLLLAISQFNSGEWFECHETLEELWIGKTGEMRDFYQGILQVGVALHHWRNGNFRGAVSLFESGAGYLRNVPPVYQRVAVAELVQAADRARIVLLELGPNRMAELDPELIPKVRIV